MDLSRWMHSGHKLWIQRQLWLHHVSSSFDAAKDIVNNSKAASIHEANLHLAATQMHDAIIGCDLITLPKAVKEDTEKLFRVLHAIPQYAHQALNFQKYKEACAQARAELQKLRDPNRTLTDEERRAIVDKVDEVLGLK
jgi:transaldolase